MENEDFLKGKYRENIQHIIDKNKRFYGNIGDIKWDYYSKDNKYEYAYNKNKKVYINIVAVHNAVKTNNTMYIEYFIIHEIRHIYQYYCIDLYNRDFSKCPNSNHAKMWKDNYDNYKNYDNQEEYYNQIVEFDAFVFAMAVIQYVYREKNYVVPPKYYVNNENYYLAVNCLIYQFKLQNM